MSKPKTRIHTTAQFYIASVAQAAGRQRFAMCLSLCLASGFGAALVGVAALRDPANTVVLLACILFAAMVPVMGLIAILELREVFRRVDQIIDYTQRTSMRSDPYRPPVKRAR